LALKPTKAPSQYSSLMSQPWLRIHQDPMTGIPLIALFPASENRRENVS